MRALGHHLEASAGGGDLLLRRLAERLRVHGQPGLQLAFAQDLHFIIRAANQTARAQRLRGNGVTRGMMGYSRSVPHAPVYYKKRFDGFVDLVVAH